jgi:hypothetical protein
MGDKIRQKRLGKPTSKKGKSDGPKSGVSKAHKARKSPNDNKGKKILQCDLDGNVIKEWENAVKAAEYIGIHNESIRQCLIGKCKSSAGYVWKYLLS